MLAYGDEPIPCFSSGRNTHMNSWAGRPPMLKELRQHLEAHRYRPQPAVHVLLLLLLMPRTLTSQLPSS